METPAGSPAWNYGGVCGTAAPGRRVLFHAEARRREGRRVPVRHPGLDPGPTFLGGGRKKVGTGSSPA